MVKKRTIIKDINKSKKSKSTNGKEAYMSPSAKQVVIKVSELKAFIEGTEDFSIMPFNTIVVDEDGKLNDTWNKKLNNLRKGKLTKSKLQGQQIYKKLK